MKFQRFSFFSHCLATVCFFLLAGVSRGQEKQWNFDGGIVSGLNLPKGKAVLVDDTDVPGGKLLKIATDLPHHTVAVIDGSEAAEDFILSLRVRLTNFSGATPVAYLYGRRHGGEFCGLQISAGNTNIISWHGRKENNPSFGPTGMRLTAESGWLNLKFACLGKTMAAKAWKSGGREPGWQINGSDENLRSGPAGFGVWTHPQRASSAEILFDDVVFTPLTDELVSREKLRRESVPQLTRASVNGRRGVFSVGENLCIASDASALLVDAVTGSILSIIDLKTEQEFVRQGNTKPLFSGTLYDGESGRAQSVSARDFSLVEVKRKSDSECLVSFGEHIEYSLQAVASIRADADGCLRFGFTMKNESRQALGAIKYPIAPAPGVLAGDGSEDRLLLPWSAGGLLSAPGTKGLRREVRYPGSLHAQFTALYNPTAGIYWAAEDAAGHCKTLQLHCIANHSSSMIFGHQFPRLPGEDFTLPYPVAMTTFQGDWMDAADRYRDWAGKQPWCATKLTQRQDIPQFLKEGSGIVISSIVNEKQRERLFGKEFEKLPDLLDAYREATGLKHLVFIPYGWENRGTWAGINYLPAVPSNETWIKANRELVKRGHRSAFLTSAYWWVVRRQKVSSGPAFDDTEDFLARQHLCVKNADGSVWNVNNYEKTKIHGSWRGYSVGLCHGCEEANACLKETFLNIAKLGVPLISFDQEIGGGQPAPCFDPKHNHPPGWGCWMWTGFRDLCQDILKDGKPIQPELGLFLENVSEVAIPQMATYWSRQFGEFDVGVGGARGIGLFSYLYHDYITLIGAACVQGQGKLGTRPDSKIRCRIFANNLTRGLIPGPFLHEIPLSGGDPWRKTVSAAYRSFCRPYANFPQYLLLGRAVRPPRIESEKVPSYFFTHDNKNGKKQRPNGPKVRKVETEIVAVTAGSFKAEDGSVGTVVVNATDQPRSVRVALDQTQAHTLHSADGKTLPLPKPGADKFTVLNLEPFGVRMIVSR